MSNEVYVMPGALVVRVDSIVPHPNADKLVLVRFPIPVDYHVHGHHTIQCVTGPHYRAHGEGVWFPPGSLLPGYLADDMWLQKGARLFEVRSFPIRGELSEGIFAGASWRKTVADPFTPWKLYRSGWKVGQDVSDYFGVSRPPSSAVEHLLVKQEAAAKTTEAIVGHAVEALGSTPAVGST